MGRYARTVLRGRPSSANAFTLGDLAQAFVRRGCCWHSGIVHYTSQIARVFVRTGCLYSDGFDSHSGYVS